MNVSYGYLNTQNLEDFSIHTPRYLLSEFHNKIKALCEYKYLYYC